jgi:hypothetical protein
MLLNIFFFYVNSASSLKVWVKLLIIFYKTLFLGPEHEERTESRARVTIWYFLSPVK